MSAEHTAGEPPKCAGNGQVMTPLCPSPPGSDGRETGYELFGDWSPLSDGGRTVNAYRCSSRGRLEFTGPQVTPAD